MSDFQENAFFEANDNLEERFDDEQDFSPEAEIEYDANGNFFYEEVAIIKIELFNKVQQNFNQMLSPQKFLQRSEENLETEVVDIQG